MILKKEFEKLYSAGNGYGSSFYRDKEIIDFDELEKASKEICTKWEDYYCDNTNEVNFRLSDDMKLEYKTVDGKIRKSDITEYAFSQLCIRLGIPAKYISKCFEANKMELAINNFKEWSLDCDKILLIRENQGVIRAVLSESFVPYDSYKVLKTLKKTVDRDKYSLYTMFLSEDKMHLRFIDKKPLNIEKENSNIFGGFTVSSSDVGSGSLNMKYHLYRQICKNGMMVGEDDGVLFREKHIGSKMSDGKLNLFYSSLENVNELNNKAEHLITDNQNVVFDDFMYKVQIEKIQKDLKMSEKAKADMNNLIENVYNKSKWGILNSITELAQKFTLDKRIEMETYAGNMLYKG